MNYDYLIVGAGFFGATVAERLAAAGKKILVIDRRPHLAGNAYSYTDQETGIEIHQYGSHIFHTESDEVWDYITKFTEFNDYVHTVPTRHEDKLYPMPINLDTINLLYNKNFTAEEAKSFIAEEIKKDIEKYQIKEPKNFEEKGITLIGEKLYQAFIKNYTEKQWGTDAKNLSAEILKRIPVRFDHDNRYFASAKYQGIPKAGYTKIVENMLQSENIEVRLGTSFKDVESEIEGIKVIYTGPVDELLNYELGILPYRSLRFETEWTEKELVYAVVNEADKNVPYTRTHDYKYYQIHQPEVLASKKSYLCREYPADYKVGKEAYYPVNNAESEALYQKYLDLLKERYPNIILGGRLGAYRYWDMDVAIKNALDLASSILKK